MSLLLSPLDESSLPPAVKKVAAVGASPQIRLLAARGMVPLSPAELLVALYQIGVTEAADSALRGTAERTARELPDAVLGPAVATALDGRVLDWLACGLAARPAILQMLLGNSGLLDETFVHLARTANDAALEQIAQNEQRLLACPAIVTALYLNPKTRMSTAQRALELAIRNGIAVEGIHAFEEVKAAIESEGGVDPSVDAAFRSAVSATAADAIVEAVGDEEVQAQVAEEADRRAGVHGEMPPDQVIQIGKLPMAAKLRLATLGNVFARAILVRDKNRVVAMAAVRNPGTTEHEAERYAANRALHEDVIRHIAGQRQFTRRYSVKMNLVNNPKCPLQIAMGFLGHLTPRDLRTVARSKGVSSALTKAAQGLLAKRDSK